MSGLCQKALRTMARNVFTFDPSLPESGVCCKSWLTLLSIRGTGRKSGAACKKSVFSSIYDAMRRLGVLSCVDSWRITLLFHARGKLC